MTGMEEVVLSKVALVREGRRSLEDFDVRMLTSGCYIHGLRAWGRQWAVSQLLLVRSEDLFAETATTLARVVSFVGLRPFTPTTGQLSPRNHNSMAKATPSALLNATLDDFFAPYNEQLYEWAARRGTPFARWPNASIRRAT